MTIYFTVTTDLNYDQRMIRICTSLQQAGYTVILVGRKNRTSQLLTPQPYKQKRLNCFLNKGKFFYVEYNLRLFFWLLFKKMDCICAIDLDTILPCYYISLIKKVKRVYDAHELFCEMQEVVTRPMIYKIWKRIERHTVPNFKHGYTVNKPIKDEFAKMYNVSYDVIRNIAYLNEVLQSKKNEKFILYQGAVNEGRSFETLIPAMQWVNAPLLIYGEGNFLETAKVMVKNYALENKVIFKGKVLPQELRNITQKACIGITLFESKGLSNYYSLANRFFDYIHAGVPQLCVDYPVYRDINDQFNVASLIKDLSAEKIAASLNILLENEVYYNELQRNCLTARQHFNWQQEEKQLIQFYQKIFD
jgi:glycosyltransferase involved in cell wall biosynthesis